jgi:polysaccharide export outer membrane protein
MRARRRSQIRYIGIFVLALGLWTPATPAAAEYRLEVGDVIEISVAQAPDLQRRVPVQPDGSISFPGVGTIVVAGLSPLEVQAKIQAALATRVMRHRTPDGREEVIAIEPSDVTAIIVQYRPIYVNGDVSKPGEYPYRPFVTVRQAVALAGGYDTRLMTAQNPSLLIADLKAECVSLWLEYVDAQLRGARIRAELEAKDSIDRPAWGEVPVSPAVLAEMLKLANDELKTRLSDYQREKSYLQQSLKQAGQQAAVLAEQSAKETEGVQADVDELRRATELLAKGSVISTRVTDARRAVLLSSTRQLQTASQLMQVRKQQDDLSRQLERLDDQRKIALLQELAAANVKSKEVQAKLRSAQEKLEYAASPKALGSAGKPHLTVLRKGPNGWESRPAEEDVELEPGDVVEIALSQEPSAAALTR